MTVSIRTFLAASVSALFAFEACGSASHDGSASSFSGGAGSGSVTTGSSSDGGSTSAMSGFTNSGGMLGADASTAASDSGAPATGTAGGCGGDGGNAVVTVTIRDFKMYSAGGTNPDFENATGAETGIVDTTLGSDHKPVYARPTGMTRTTHGKMYFDQWFNDTAGVNLNVQYPVTLTSGAGGTCGYDSLVSGPPNTTPGMNSWFPIDDGTAFMTAFGNQGEAHNYSFTSELHTVFTYNGGETFSFSGDDDVFVFINNQLVIDLGGVHTREVASIKVDSLGLTLGTQYPLDLFSAERHTVESNFSFTTTLQLSPAPAPPPK